MNYRHLFHAGNFADVFKHSILVQLMRAMQQKERGFLGLDTHAGRGGYDLTQTARGESLERKPEWPDGIGRLRGRDDLPEPLAEFAALVERFDRARGNLEPAARFYPGSPWLMRLLARAQDRLAFCEKHPEEQAILGSEFDLERRTSTHLMDGYVAIRAMLPPPEKRAFVLIDPPFEDPDEFDRVLDALREGLARMPSAVFAIWYPLTERAGVEAFWFGMERLGLPPTLTFELAIAGSASAIKMKGCGVTVVNPPWQIEQRVTPMIEFLASELAQDTGGAARTTWLVKE
jgi:23S rRNA (adenine2030-N6)-methyltransferase